MECNFVLILFQGYFRYYHVVFKMILKGFIKLSDKDGILRNKNAERHNKPKKKKKTDNLI